MHELSLPKAGTALWQSSSPWGWLLQRLWWIQGENGVDPVSLDPASFPKQPATSRTIQIQANLRHLPRVRWVPPQPGQQALAVLFHATGHVSRGLAPWSRQKGGDVSVQPTPLPGNGLDSHSI